KSVEEMPRANTVFIGKLPPTTKFDPSKTVEKIFVKAGDARHPVMRYIERNLNEIGVGTAIRVLADELPPGTPRLLEAEGNVVLMFALARDPFTDVVQTFPLVNDKDEWNTNWLLKPSFPIFW